MTPRGSWFRPRSWTAQGRILFGYTIAFATTQQERVGGFDFLGQLTKPAIGVAATLVFAFAGAFSAPTCWARWRAE